MMTIWEPHTAHNSPPVPGCMTLLRGSLSLSHEKPPSKFVQQRNPSENCKLQTKLELQSVTTITINYISHNSYLRSFWVLLGLFCWMLVDAVAVAHCIRLCEHRVFLVFAFDQNLKIIVDQNMNHSGTNI